MENLVVLRLIKLVVIVQAAVEETNVVLDLGEHPICIPHITDALMYIQHINCITLIKMCSYTISYLQTYLMFVSKKWCVNTS